MRFHDAVEDSGIVLPTALRRRLEQPRFEPEMFTATKFATAGEKAAFARHFARFVTQGMPVGQFTKPFYQRLSNTFGHIAHYNQHGFFAEFFADPASKVRFLEQTLGHWPVGDPAWTFVDVERELQVRIHAAQLLPLYRSLLSRTRQTPSGPAPAHSRVRRCPSIIPAARPPQANLFDLG